MECVKCMINCFYSLPITGKQLSIHACILSYRITLRVKKHMYIQSSPTGQQRLWIKSSLIDRATCMQQESFPRVANGEVNRKNMRSRTIRYIVPIADENARFSPFRNECPQPGDECAHTVKIASLARFFLSSPSIIVVYVSSEVPADSECLPRDQGNADIFTRAGAFPRSSPVQGDGMLAAAHRMRFRTSRRWRAHPFAPDTENAAPYPDPAPRNWAWPDSAPAAPPASQPWR